MASELTVTINTNVPTNREFRRMHWSLREAKRYEMLEAIKAALLLEKRPDVPFEGVRIETSSRALPEHYYLDPLFSVLRAGSWISNGASITLVCGRVGRITLTFL